MWPPTGYFRFKDVLRYALRVQRFECFYATSRGILYRSTQVCLWHRERNILCECINNASHYTFACQLTNGWILLSIKRRWISGYAIQYMPWNNVMTSSNGNIFRVTGHLCGEFTGHRWIPPTKASDADIWCFSVICGWINGWVQNRESGRKCQDYVYIKWEYWSTMWFEMPSRQLWRHCNEHTILLYFVLFSYIISSCRFMWLIYPY